MSGQLPPGKIAPGWLPHRQLPTRIIAPEENCPRGRLPLGQLPPRKTVPPENCSLTIKFPSKISAPTPANSPQRVLRVNWGKLCIVYDYVNKRVLQLRSKNRFTSIYFLQILPKPCSKPLIREHFSLNVSWFSFARTQKKKNFFVKNWFGKNTKKLHSK